MAIDFEAEVGGRLPTSAKPRIPGTGIVVPIPTTAASVPVVGRGCYLLGWSFRETTGTAPAVAELFDGASAGGSFLSAIDLTGGSGGPFSQTPVSQSLSGANAAQAPQVGGGAGTLAFVQSISLTGLGATAAGQVTAVLSGLLGGSISYPITVPAGATVPITPIFDTFGTPGLQASAAATAIVLTLPAFGAGNTLEEAALNGYTVPSPVAGSTPGGGSSTQWLGYPGLLVQAGLFLNVVSGSLKGAVWIRK